MSVGWQSQERAFEGQEKKPKEKTNRKIWRKRKTGKRICWGVLIFEGESMNQNIVYKDRNIIQICPGMPPISFGHWFQSRSVPLLFLPTSTSLVSSTTNNYCHKVAAPTPCKQSLLLSSNRFFQCKHPLSDNTDGYNLAHFTMKNQGGSEIWAIRPGFKTVSWQHAAHVQ